MKQCDYCGKHLPPKKRRYCDATCSNRFKKEGPAREQYVYKEVEKDAVDVSILKEGAWLLFPVAQEDEQCIGDFMRVFQRAPKHVIFDPKTPMWKFAGPVWTEEEQARRWRGWQEEKDKHAK